MKSSKYNQPHDLDHSPQVDSVGQSLQLLPAGRIQVKRDRMAREVQKHEGLAHQKVLLQPAHVPRSGKSCNYGIAQVR